MEQKAIDYANENPDMVANLWIEAIKRGDQKAIDKAKEILSEDEHYMALDVYSFDQTNYDYLIEKEEERKSKAAAEETKEIEHLNHDFEQTRGI